MSNHSSVNGHFGCLQLWGIINYAAMIACVQVFAWASHTLVKWCLKFSKSGFSNMWTVNFQMFKLVLEKAGNQRSNCQYPLDHRKAREFQKNTICSDFGAKEKNKVSHCFPIYLPWSDGTGCHDLSFLNVEL